MSSIENQNQAGQGNPSGQQLVDLPQITTVSVREQIKTIKEKAESLMQDLVQKSIAYDDIRK